MTVALQPQLLTAVAVVQLQPLPTPEQPRSAGCPTCAPSYAMSAQRWSTRWGQLGGRLGTVRGS